MIDKDGRIFHHYQLWEDYKAGLFHNNRRDQNKIGASIAILSDIKECDYWFGLVVQNWPFCAEVNLSNNGINRQAWLGQAACCLSHGSNEEETKIAWGQLTTEQQNRANQIADQYIKTFEQERMPNAEKVPRARRAYRCERTYSLDL